MYIHIYNTYTYICICICIGVCDRRVAADGGGGERGTAHTGVCIPVCIRP